MVLSVAHVIVYAFETIDTIRETHKSINEHIFVHIGNFTVSSLILRPNHLRMDCFSIRIALVSPFFCYS